jgi:hypothetical protein
MEIQTLVTYEASKGLDGPMSNFDLDRNLGTEVESVLKDMIVDEEG